jgi:hypothetical protein
MPTLTPSIIPGPAIKALALLIAQVPPGIASVNVMPEPTHTAELPKIVPPLAGGITVITDIAEVVPQPLVSE